MRYFYLEVILGHFRYGISFENLNSKMFHTRISLKMVSNAVHLKNVRSRNYYAPNIQNFPIYNLVLTLYGVSDKCATHSVPQCAKCRMQKDRKYQRISQNIFEKKIRYLGKFFGASWNIFRFCIFHVFHLSDFGIWK